MGSRQFGTENELGTICIQPCDVYAGKYSLTMWCGRPWAAWANAKEAYQNPCEECLGAIELGQPSEPKTKPKKELAYGGLFEAC